LEKGFLLLVMKFLEKQSLLQYTIHPLYIL